MGDRCAIDVCWHTLLYLSINTSRSSVSSSIVQYWRLLTRLFRMALKLSTCPFSCGVYGCVNTWFKWFSVKKSWTIFAVNLGSLSFLISIWTSFLKQSFDCKWFIMKCSHERFTLSFVTENPSIRYNHYTNQWYNKKSLPLPSILIFSVILINNSLPWLSGYQFGKMFIMKIVNNLISHSRQK